MSANFALKIYQQAQTAFTFSELAQLFPGIDYQSLKNRVKYAVKTGKLASPRRSFYVKPEYNFWELANKIYTPSYVSLETVLAQAGIVFQKYETVFMVSYLTRRIKVAGRQIFYRKIKDEILVNKTGVENIDGIFIASKEKAFLDAVFLYKDYHFDNLRPLDWVAVEAMVGIYHSRALERRLKDYAPQR